MRATGIVRKVDELGRVVLPIELRRELGVSYNDNLGISVHADNIILTKYMPKCVFCKGTEEVITKMGQHVCRKCISEV